MAKTTRRKRKLGPATSTSASAPVVAQLTKRSPSKLEASQARPRGVRKESSKEIERGDRSDDRADDRLPLTLEQRSEASRRRAGYLLGGVVLLFAALYGVSKCSATEDAGSANTSKVPALPSPEKPTPTQKPLLEPTALPIGEEVLPPAPTPIASDTANSEVDPRTLIEPPVPPALASSAPGLVKPATSSAPTPQKTEAPPLPKAPPSAANQPPQAPLPQSGDIYSP